MQKHESEKLDYEHGVFLLSVLRNQKETREAYLKFTGGAELLATDVYRFVLAPRGW